MKVAIFGASGAAGLQLTSQALRSGHEVTAFVRNPERIPLKHPNLRTVKGDVLHLDEVEHVIIGQDAVLCALGAGKKSPPDLCSQGTQRIVSAMQNHNVRRIIVITGFGTSKESRVQFGFVTKLMVHLTGLLFYREFTDKQRQDSYVRQSDLDWTIIQPPTLTNGPQTGQYKHGQFPATLLGKISRADLAEFIMNELDVNHYIKQSTIIQY